MDYKSLVRIKLQRDLLCRLKSHYSKYETILSKKEYEDLIQPLLTKHCENFTMTFYDEYKHNYKNTNVQCCAREWFHHLGRRCPHLRMNNTSDYCKKHQNIINQNERLNFGRYDEPRPIYNENGSKILWYKHTLEERLTILLQYQNLRVQERLKHIK
jgi:hypothetical protein